LVEHDSSAAAPNVALEASGQESERAAAAGTEPKGGSPDLLRPLDDQEVRLLERLRAAHGEPASFHELRADGIENPGQLCYDLDRGRAHRARRSTRRIRSVGIRLGIAPKRVRQ
jgi:hypothetical protein